MKKQSKRIKTYIGRIDCPCGLRGDHFMIYNPDTKFLYHIVLHHKYKYSAQRYADLKRQEVPVNVRKNRASQFKIKTWECYLGRY